MRTPLGSDVPDSGMSTCTIDAHTLTRAIERAHTRLAGQVIRTPTIRLPFLDGEGREVWAKLESQQHSGSFKYRGAYYALSNTKFCNIIAASAGNHALAVAAAGKQLRKNVRVVAPTTASELKINRLLVDADVTLLGQDLFEATKWATQIAKDSPHDVKDGLYFVSPYANIDVAAGAGTAIVEAVEDAGHFDSVILPLGGGGLAAAVGAWCSVRSPRTKVICTHPEVFGRAFHKSRSTAEQLNRPTSATYSDGLGVQLTEQTPFAAILDQTVDRVVQVSEHITAAAIAYLLRLQSLLVEGASATTVGALIDQSKPLADCTGRVLVLLTGGNISSSNVAKALVADVSESSIRQKLGLRHIMDPLERHGAVNGHDSHRKMIATDNCTVGVSEYWELMLSRTISSLDDLWKRFDQKQGLNRTLALQSDQWCITVFVGMHQQAQRLAAELKADLSLKTRSELPVWKLEERYRVLLQLQANLSQFFERASAAYDQSQRDWFFNPVTQNAAAVNYDRYGLAVVRAAELRLLDVIRPGKPSIELLLTSSGMAAYNVIQQYLLQNMAVGSAVVLPPYIYFEAMEQLQGLRHIRLCYSSSYAEKDILDTAESCNASAVFIDPVANVVGLPMTNIRQFALLTSQRPGWESRIVVIDGTMISGAMPVYDWFQGPHAPTVLYYESASKYLQLGLDVQMGGVVLYPTALDEAMRTIRRNLGAVMYSRGASLLPPVDSLAYQSRMSVLTANAEKIYLSLHHELSAIADVQFPAKWRAFGWRHGGALVTIRFLREGMNNKEGLEASIDTILRTAERLGVPMIKGVSFGFSTSRISSASSMAKDSDPFLRISVGVEVEHTDPLITAVCVGVGTYHAQFERDAAD
ncbi:hypothetical protein DL765_009028 [Monosporascus sp. GIB2]|nr:hypothetical protein DL765_009028 [Monosporascus sp. GIB2]